MLMGILNESADITGKKGQAQETILVIFVFVVIIILGMIAFMNFQKNSIKNDFVEFQRTRVSSNMITLPGIPEFSCTKGGIRERCVDTLKLIAFKNIAERRKAEIGEKFGNLNITVYKIYPDKNSEKCDKDNLEECGVWEVYIKKPAKASSKIVQKIPISLYDPKDDSYSIGVMIVEAYNI